MHNIKSRSKWSGIIPPTSIAISLSVSVQFTSECICSPYAVTSARDITFISGLFFIGPKTNWIELSEGVTAACVGLSFDWYGEKCKSILAAAIWLHIYQITQCACTGCDAIHNNQTPCTMFVFASQKFTPINSNRTNKQNSGTAQFQFQYTTRAHTFIIKLHLISTVVYNDVHRR